MDRRVLTDGTNRWFDYDAATVFDEGRRWDGRNHISLATGSQWQHEQLIRTAGKQWIVWHWSQWQGSTDSYESLTDAEAAAWLVRNEHDDVPEILGEHVEALEIR